MAGKRHRVWLARLGYGSVLVGLLSALLAWSLWHQLTDDSPELNTSDASQHGIQAGNLHEANHTSLHDGASQLPSHPIDPLLALARRALAHHVRNHSDYTADLTKQERVGKTLFPPSTMSLKLRYTPRSSDDIDTERKVSVYLKTTKPKSQAGREVIWIQDQNDNKLKAHEAGLLGMVTVDLSPTSRLAMTGNRYPITEVGLEKLLRKLIERGERDRLLGPAEVRTSENAMIGNVPCKLLEVIHSEPWIEVDGKRVEFEFHLAQVYIDEANLVPLKYASYAWPKSEGQELELLEMYTYENLQLNVGLTDSDFDPKNANYRF